MLKKSVARLAAAGLLLTGVLCGKMARAQDAPMAEQLRAHYKLAKMGSDSSGRSVVEAGTVLVIQKGGILGVPPANAGMATSTYKDGELHGPNGFAAALVSKVSRQLPKDEKVYVTKIDVHSKDDKIMLIIVECDSCNGVQQASSYKSAVIFQFAKGYLTKADASQVEDVISELLAPEPIASQQQAQAEQPAVAPAGAQDVLQNQDIIDLAAAGFDDATILAKIEHTKCQFDTSTSALIKLKQNKVSAVVIKAMVAKPAS
ncbi:MAG TPA: hypothetical protein VKH15_10245 [Candidatus Acidoferrum sp.]|nr:hypothetical protein [Candidatus Acidoferrum sp.]